MATSIKPLAPRTMMSPLIEIQNCCLMRGDRLALNQFCLRIDQGESLAIVGPNGSGKSSLLKLIGRELYPLVRLDSFVRILGNEHFDIRDYRRSLGILSHDLQQTYDADVPGLEVVISGFFDSNSLWQHFEISDEQINQARAVMDELNISSLEDRCFGQLSTGQQRRLLLARALVHSPDTLILDEPTTGLDLTASFQYLQLLRNRLNSGKAIILVTHHLYEIPPEIDRVVLISDGKIYMDGPKNVVMQEDNLSKLFASPIGLTKSNGYYLAHPK